MTKITIKHSRAGLGEGRSSGMGFGFLKKVDDDLYCTVQAISPCKDYLNEVLYTEKTGIVLPKVHGFAYKDGKQNILDPDYGYLGIQMVQYTKGKLDDDLTQKFSQNHKNVESFLNQIESELKLETLTKITEADNGTFLVEMPSFWTSKLYLLSLYTLLLRAFQNYTGSSPALEYMKKNKGMRNDMSYIQASYPKLLKLIEGDAPEQPFPETSNGYRIHDGMGIVSTQFEGVTVEL